MLSGERQAAARRDQVAKPEPAADAPSIALGSIATAMRQGSSYDDVRATALPALQNTVARLIRAGGRVAVGSDAPTIPYGLGLHLELALLGGAGLFAEVDEHLYEASFALGI